MKKKCHCRSRTQVRVGGKIILSMKLTFLLLFLGVVQLSASVYSQTTHLSLDLDNRTVKEVLEKIEEQSEFRFFYNEKFIDLTRKVSVRITNEQVENILDEVFRGSMISYKVMENNLILITPKDGEVPASTVQEQQVRGKVTGSDGSSLPGVTVVIKGTTRGTITDIDGRYSVENVPADGILVFSFVGMRTQDIAVEGRREINVAMEEEAIGLEEVVAVGYGVMKRSDITGSVASVKAESIEKIPVSRVDQSLQGRLSGVMVQNNSAAPDSRVTIRIRGANSIQGGNDPLVVIDGFQGGDLSTINPNDIKSIEVLKDASATAIYGSRGANGVILVQTKTGKKGKTIVAYDTYFRLQQPRKLIDLMDAATYAQVVNENRVELGQDPVFTDAQITTFKQTGGTDWQKEITRDALAQNHQISISGGNDEITYYVSGNYLDREGILKNTSYDRYTLRSNITTQVSKRINVDLNLFLGKEVSHPLGQSDFSSNNAGNPVFAALVYAPTDPVYDENGDYSQPSDDPQSGPPNTYNPVALLEEPIKDNFTNTADLNAGFRYNLAKGLTIYITGGYRLVDYEYNAYYNSKPTASEGTELAGIKNGKIITMQNTNQLNYEKLFNNAHKVNITAVYEQQMEKRNSDVSSSLGFLTDAVTYNNLGFGASPQVPESSRTSRALESFMGRVNYSYANKYLLTITGRADASSVFGKNNKWGYFPSAAIGWNVISENFMKSLEEIITNLKLRGSYGVTGNQAISPYQSLGLLNINAPYPIDGTTLSTGASLGGIANPDLKWEKTTQIDGGLDIALFKGRLEFIGDYYSKKTKNLLMTVPLPKASGGDAKVLRNVGQVDNKGIELYLSGKPIDRQFKWETSLTFAKNKNEVIALSGGDDMYPLTGTPLSGFNEVRWLVVSQPLGVYRGYKQDGVWKTSEAEEAAKYGFEPGDPKIIDLSGSDGVKDGEIDANDITVIGNGQPDFTYGWTNTFTYKNFELNVFLQGIYGNDILNLSRVRSETTTADGDATSVRILDRWTPDHQDTDIPSFTGQNSFPSLVTSRWVEDGSYLRIKDITLGYNISSQLTRKLRIASARIYVSGTNLFTFTNYTGYDPESSTDVDYKGGVDVSSYPTQKIYTIGINLKL